MNDSIITGITTRISANRFDPAKPLPDTQNPTTI